MAQITTFTPKQALQRYLKIFIPSMIAYLVLIFLAVRLIKSETVTGMVVFSVAILPGLAALCFLYGFFRFIKETDEVLRRIQTDAILVGVGAILTLTLTWGILELLIETLPRLSIFYIFPIFFMVQGLASWRFSKKYGTGFCLP